MTEDSQQISVAELLKRNGQSVESRGGRRRRGVAGGISVAELTGEIPIVRQSGSRAAAEPESDEPAAQPESNHVISAEMRCSELSGSTNSTHSRGKSRSTSGLGVILWDRSGLPAVTRADRRPSNVAMCD